MYCKVDGHMQSQLRKGIIGFLHGFVMLILSEQRTGFVIQSQWWNYWYFFGIGRCVQPFAGLNFFFCPLTSVSRVVLKTDHHPFLLHVHINTHYFLQMSDQMLHPSLISALNLLLFVIYVTYSRRSSHHCHYCPQQHNHVFLPATYITSSYRKADLTWLSSTIPFSITVNIFPDRTLPHSSHLSAPFLYTATT